MNLSKIQIDLKLFIIFYFNSFHYHLIIEWRITCRWKICSLTTSPWETRMSDLQLWSQLVAKCQNTDLTIMGMPAFPKNRDTANDGAPHQVEQHVRCRDWARRHPEGKLDGIQAFMSGKLKIKGHMMLAMLTLSSEFADPLNTTEMILCHQESQRELHQCQTWRWALRRNTCRLPFAGMMTAARLPLPLEFDVISKREFDKLKQKVERLDKIFRIRIQRGCPKEEVGVWSDHCLNHEESFADKRHYTIIVAPGHQDYIKNMTTDALRMGTSLIMVPANGNFATAISKDNHKAGEIQKNQTAFEVDQHLEVRYTFIPMRKKNSSKTTFIQEHFHPKTLSSKNTIIQKHFHRKTLLSKTISSKTEDNFIQDTFIQMWFVQWHFHPNVVSSNHIFVQNRFHPMTVSSQTIFIKTLNTSTPQHLNTSTPKHQNPKPKTLP